MQKNARMLSVIFLALSFICWLLFREVFATVWVFAHLPNPAEWPVAAPDAAALAVSVILFVVLYKNPKTVTFTGDVVSELSRVAWPNRKETALSTVVVSILIVICAMILFGFDMLWGSVIKVFYQQ
jgi:preprotein translocase subunit SecE